MKTFKECLDAKEYQDAFRVLPSMVRGESDTDLLLRLSRSVEKIPREEFVKAGFLRKRIAFLGGYSTQFLVPLVKLAMLEKGIDAACFEGAFGSFRETIYSKDSDLGGFSPDVVFLHSGCEHESDPQALLDWARAVHEWLGCEVVISNLAEPEQKLLGNADVRDLHSARTSVRKFNVFWDENSEPYLHVFDVHAFSAYWGAKHFFDNRIFDLGKFGVSHELVARFAISLGSFFGAVYGRTRKVAILDLDDTIWGGVVGDDGYQNLRVGPPSAEGEAFLRFQKYLKRLKDRGVILAVCSKNGEAVAKEAFEKVAEMALRLDDFSCFFANWESKVENIRRISQQLNLGLDSMVFIDDNPSEREWVRRELPEVHVVDLPQEPSEYLRAVCEQFPFEALRITREDQMRTEQYRADAERGRARAQAGDYESYLKSLEMVAEVEAFHSGNIPRVTQLINKTNQFNLTAKRYSEAEIAGVAQDRNRFFCRALRLKDKFGDSGLVLAFIGEIQGSEFERALHIDAWVMSCRVFQRRVETHFFDYIIGELLELGIFAIKAKRVPTAKNGVIEGLLSRLGFVEGSGGDLLRLSRSFRKYEETSLIRIDETRAR